MRPNSIIQFDRFFLGSLALAGVNAVLSMQDTLADPRLARSGLGMGFIVGIQVFSFALMLALWFFISRRAGNAARWILTVMTVLGMFVTIPMVPVLAERGIGNMAFALVITVLQVAAVAFLFRSDARAWFARKGGIAPDDQSIFS